MRNSDTRVAGDNAESVAERILASVRRVELASLTLQIGNSVGGVGCSSGVGQELDLSAGLGGYYRRRTVIAKISCLIIIRTDYYPLP